MFLKQERHEMDDFEKNKETLCLQQKYVEKFQYFNGYPCKNFAKYFCMCFFMLIKTPAFLSDGGGGPPLADKSAQNVSFYVLPYSCQPAQLETQKNSYLFS